MQLTNVLKKRKRAKFHKSHTTPQGRAGSYGHPEAAIIAAKRRTPQPPISIFVGGGEWGGEEQLDKKDSAPEAVKSRGKGTLFSVTHSLHKAASA